MAHVAHSVHGHKVDIFLSIDIRNSRISCQVDYYLLVEYTGQSLDWNFHCELVLCLLSFKSFSNTRVGLYYRQCPKSTPNMLPPSFDGPRNCGT